jgi:hypothetical protein
MCVAVAVAVEFLRAETVAAAHHSRLQRFMRTS